MIKQDRSLGMYILLTILTCGIYPLYFWYKAAEDVNIICNGDGEETTSGAELVILFLLCGFYTYYWLYKLGDRLQRNSKRYGMEFQESGTTVLLWLILGMFIVVGPFVAWYILIKNLNLLARAYNNNIGRQNGAQANNYYGQGANFNQNYNTPNYGNQGYNGQNYGNANEYAHTQPLSYNANMQGGVTLKCTSGEFSGAVFHMNINDKILIGRDMSCNIKLNSNTPKISRQHCTVEFDGHNIWLTDMHSSFGTYLTDGTKLTPMNKVSLRPGMGFYLGDKNVSFIV